MTMLGYVELYCLVRHSMKSRRSGRETFGPRFSWRQGQAAPKATLGLGISDQLLKFGAITTAARELLAVLQDHDVFGAVAGKQSFNLSRVHYG